MNIRRVVAAVSIVAVVAAAINIIGSRTKRPSATRPHAAPTEINRLPSIEHTFDSVTLLAGAAESDDGRPTIQRLPAIGAASKITRLPAVSLHAPTQSPLFPDPEHEPISNLACDEELNSNLACDEEPKSNLACTEHAPSGNVEPSEHEPKNNAFGRQAEGEAEVAGRRRNPSSTKLAADTDVVGASAEMIHQPQSVYAGNGPLSGEYDFERSMEVSAGFETELIPLKVSPEQLDAIRVPRDIARRANQLLDSAVLLADRGAIYAARREFLRVTRMIAKQLDAQLGQQFHTRQLAAGLRALEEADDFALVRRDDADDDVHLDGFIAGHRTPVLQGVAPEELTPLVAMQRYYEYARQQLTLAGGHEPTASRALFAVGRAESLLKKDDVTAVQSGPKAIAFFQAALAVDATNTKAANELAVMLADHGKLQRAAEVLRGVMANRPSRTMVLNYAHLCSRLGDQRAAAEARQVAQSMPTVPGELVANRPRVEWVPPEAFAGGANPDVVWAPPVPNPAAQPPAPPTRNAMAKPPAAQPWPMF